MLLISNVLLIGFGLITTTASVACTSRTVKKAFRGRHLNLPRILHLALKQARHWHWSSSIWWRGWEIGAPRTRQTSREMAYSARAITMFRAIDAFELIVMLVKMTVIEHQKT